MINVVISSNVWSVLCAPCISVVYCTPAPALLQYTLDCQKYGDKEGNKKRHVKRCLAKH